MSSLMNLFQQDDGVSLHVSIYLCRVNRVAKVRSCFFNTSTSRNGYILSFSASIINLIFLYLLFRCFRKLSSCVVHGAGFKDDVLWSHWSSFHLFASLVIELYYVFFQIVLFFYYVQLQVSMLKVKHENWRRSNTSRRDKSASIIDHLVTNMENYINCHTNRDSRCVFFGSQQYFSWMQWIKWNTTQPKRHVNQNEKEQAKPSYITDMDYLIKFSLP